MPSAPRAAAVCEGERLSRGSLNNRGRWLWVPARGDDIAFAFRHKQKPRAHRPGFFGQATPLDQAAAGLNSFDALALIGSAVSLATFWVSSASSLVCAVNASNCFLA